jgi:putative transposase
MGKDKVVAPGSQFSSALVPPYVRRAASVEAALPWLYLHGIAQADVGLALEALLGEQAKNLSSSVISRLKQTREKEYSDNLTSIQKESKRNKSKARGNRTG